MHDDRREGDGRLVAGIAHRGDPHRIGARGEPGRRLPRDRARARVQAVRRHLAGDRERDG